MTACRWNRDAEDYLTDDGAPCKRDEYGDPTRHCTARRTCSWHIGPGEITCARCIGRTRDDIRKITDLATLMLPAAISEGVDSQPAMLAGPSSDPRHWSARRIAMRAHLATFERYGRITEAQHMRARAAMDDDDELHPYAVTTRWQMMLAEDYGHPLPDKLTTATATAYLTRHLHTVANDPDQDFALLAREMRRCRAHLESVLHNSTQPERGAPCVACPTPAPRLVRHYGHYCTDPDCTRQYHYTDDTYDRWVCPANREHVWKEADYRLWVEAIAEGRRDGSA